MDWCGMRTVATAAIFTLVVMTTYAPVNAAGIDPRGYTCAELHSMIASRGYVFLSQPAFGDFVVANVSCCPGGVSLQLRSVQTRDKPDCIVKYCANISPEGRGGGM
jgi:hypothetical protein